MSFIVQTAMRVSAPKLVTPVSLDTQIIDGKSFVTIGVGDRTFTRLVAGTSRYGCARIAYSSIVNDIYKLIREAWIAKVGATPQRAASLKFQAYQRLVVLTAGSVVAVTMPELGNIPSRELFVVLSAPSSDHRITIEINADVLGYFKDAVAARIDAEPDEPIHEHHPSWHTDDKFDNRGYMGISMEYSKKRIRASKIVDGKTVNKYIKVSEIDDGEALQKAIMYIEGSIDSPTTTSTTNDSSTDSVIDSPTVPSTVPSAAIDSPEELEHHAKPVRSAWYMIEN